MILTEHQNIKINEVLDLLKKNNRILITGSAGVGKTTIADKLIKIISKDFKSNEKIYCSAPTNKAVSVLKSKIKNYNNLQFITTHSALKLKRTINYKTGEISFKPSFNENNLPLTNVKLLIIDEASMLSSELLEKVEYYANINKTIVIFLGDFLQLNPVNEINSPVFTKNYVEVNLTEILRQGKDNPIIKLSRNLELIKLKQNDVIINKGFIYTNDTDKIIEKLAEVNGTDELKYLAYTNAEVNNINKKVRQKIYKNPNKIEENETLIFNTPYKETYYIHQEIFVKKLMIINKTFSLPFNNVYDKNFKQKNIQFKCYSLNPYYIEKNIYCKENLFHSILVIHEDSEKDFDNINNILKQAAKKKEIDWKDYYIFIEQFADLTYNHAITIHSSQGSTYEKVILNIENVNYNKNKKEKKRLLYTAVTRASNLLILYKV